MKQKEFGFQILNRINLKLLFFIFFLIPLFSNSQNNIKNNYDTAFVQLNKMIENDNISFKNAVFITENAYFDNKLNYQNYCNKILNLTKLVTIIEKNQIIIYEESDYNDFKKQAAIFRVLKDSIQIKMDSISSVIHLPFIYDFNDIFGEQNWSNMFVSKLLDTYTGNCHSLPFLYKIIAEELGVEAHLALAPNHIYIKTKSEKFGWYNTELTSGMFPIDAWIMASGYIHLTAIQNQLYMSALDDKQSIAICMTDLAEGYARKTEFSDPDFVIMCCDTALNYFPNYVNAMLLKIKTRKYQFETELQKDEPNKELADEYFNEMQTLASKLHQLGYRQMPKEMYLDWLISLKLEQDKYTNKQIMNDK